MVAGMAVVNMGVRKGWATNLDKEKTGETASSGLIPKDQQRPLGHATVSSDAINGLALQLCFVLLSMWLGKIIFTNLAKIPVEPVANIMGKIPSLLYGIVGAAIVWAVMCKTHLDGYADKEAVDNISGVALEICICSATATLNLELFASFLVPILIHMVAIIVLMTFVCVFLLKRWMKKDWFELCLMAFGQGHGSTPSGLALARCVDPDHKSTSWEAFGVALGCVTPVTSALAAILPILAVQSQWIPVGIGAAVTLACLLFGELVIRKNA
jgi:ESS family glutamate:Na+ symporter